MPEKQKEPSQRRTACHKGIFILGENRESESEQQDINLHAIKRRYCLRGRKKHKRIPKRGGEPLSKDILCEG